MHQCMQLWQSSHYDTCLAYIDIDIDKFLAIERLQHCRIFFYVSLELSVVCFGMQPCCDCLEV